MLWFYLVFRSMLSKLQLKDTPRLLAN